MIDDYHVCRNGDDQPGPVEGCIRCWPERARLVAWGPTAQETIAADLVLVDLLARSRQYGTTSECPRLKASRA